MTLADLLKGYRIIDLSHTLEEWMPRPQVPYGHIPWKSYRRGDSYNTFMILVFEHAGTHLDAPIHLGGVEGPSIDEIPLKWCFGSCSVLEMKEKDERALVSVEDIERWEETHGRIGEGEMVLFNYGWENRWRAPSGVENQPYLRDYPGLSKEAAEYLVNKGVKLVGSDTPSIDSYADPEEKAHRVLLPRRVLILENAKGLDLLPPRGALLMALPLKIKGGTGSPVRAVAFVPREASAQSKQ